MSTPIDPRSFERNNWMGLYCVLHGYGLWMGVGGLGYLLWSAALPWPVRVALLLPCVLVSGLGLFYITTLVHEGFHGSLNKNRHVSMAMGVVAGSGVPLFACIGYTLRHWHHHLYTNTSGDPDFADYSVYKTWLSRVVHGPVRSLLGFIRTLFLVLFRPGRVDLRHYPFSLPVLRRYAVLNVLASVSFLALYISLAIHKPVLMVMVVLLPALVTNCYLGMVPFIDHACTGLTKGANARTYTSSLFTVLLLGTNYHREHHLHPSMPSYKLIALHRHYVAAGEVPDLSVVEPGMFAALRIGATGTLDQGH